MAKYFCLKTYYKERAEKQIRQWLFIAVVTILFLTTFATCDALAATYVDVSGESENLCPLGGGITCDAGTFDFEAEPPSENSGAQLYSTGQPDDFELRGWLWDTNLGWISLYCPESGVNLGVACRPGDSEVTYGVKVDLEGDGSLYGWAWSDNMGWISFGCVEGRNDEFACGSRRYESGLQIDVTEKIGFFSGFAWADTVGWFSLKGINAQILDIVMTENTSESEWGVWTKGEIAVDGLTAEQKNAVPKKNTMPIANDGEGYDLFVHVADITGTPVVDIPGQVKVDIGTAWYDSVYLDQTVEDPTAPDDGKFSSDNTGAVIKPGIGANDLVYKADATTGGIPNSYHGAVRSIAPTDGGNCWDGDGDGSCYTGDGNYFYKNFGEDIPDQKLEYEGATVTVTIIPTGETWTESITPLGYAGGRVMEFLPIVDIPVLDFMLPGNPPRPANVIQATRNKEDVFNIRGQLNTPWAPGYRISLDLEQDNPDVYFQFIESLDDVPVAERPIPPLEFNSTLPIGEYYAIPFVPDIQLAEQITGAMIRSTIELFGSGGVKYFNNGLPRTDESVILNQSAEIVSGSVFSPGAKEVTKGAEVPLFGDTAVYELRTQILGDVSGLIRGIEPVQGANTEFTIDAGVNATVLDDYALQNGRVYYFKNYDLHLESTDPLTSVMPDRPITLIVEGGDIYIDTNIDTDEAFGLISLESRTDDSEATGGGHIYVRDDVTDMVEVSIFSDGPMYRYTDEVCFYWGNDSTGTPALRAPNFVEAGWCSSASGNYREPVAALPNQFYLRGNVASLNCIGCSAGLEPTRGDGKLLGGPSAKNYANARLYDFNYFSYYREDPMSPGTFPGNESYTVQASPIIDPAKKNLPVYFEYSPAPSDLLGFRTY